MVAKQKNLKPNIVSRPPIVVIMGHIDHGKSTLLDYIRKSNTVDTEVGGITQHLSAYIVEHKNSDGEIKPITFLDTPGHAAFQKMRLRGADVSDIAILIVSAEDGVKPQTLEALKSIKAAEIPYLVAINKIDKPGADINRTKASLIENEIYLEGMGGDIPWCETSAKTGDGVDELLDLLLLSAELAELTGDKNAAATGVVIEGNLDPKRGITATLIVKNGTLKNGTFAVSGESYAPLRMLQNWNGQTVKEATLSEPIGVIGWNAVPQAGSTFTTIPTKKEAGQLVAENNSAVSSNFVPDKTGLPLIPLLIKTDVLGSIEAVEYELKKFKSDRISVKVIGANVGDITAADVQAVSATKNAIIVGFNVKVERAATDLAERLGVEINTFSIIYELSKWLEAALKNRTPKQTETQVTGKAKILKHFSTQKNILVLGARIEEGWLKVGQSVKLTRRDIEIGSGMIENLQKIKANVDKVEEGEFGMQLESKSEIAPGDYIEAFNLIVV